MSEKIIFCNTGWMDFYKGLMNDSITGGGKYVDNMGWGSEMFNFKRFNNKYFGYVQPKINRHNPSIIKLEKLGGTETDESISGVTVVWTATDPHNGGTYITGWYKNATVYRYYQDPPRNSKRRHKNEAVGYYISAKTGNCKLLTKDERNVRVQRQKKNWMGQSNVWYAENNPDFVQEVKDYIFKDIIPPKVRGLKRRGGARQSDPLKRIEVEKKAVLVVTSHYKKLGYKIESFEKDNVGWDLTAKNDKTELKLEVKGLSGFNVATELTPNEFKNLTLDKIFYRLCVVTSALTRPKLNIFAYSHETNEWTSEEGVILNFERVISAKVYA